MKKRLLIYSDCYVYGGSERLMASIISSKPINEDYHVQMAYRSHRIYEEGLAKEYSASMRSRCFIALRIIANDTLFYRLVNSGISKWLLVPLKTFFWAVEKTGFYWLWNLFQFIYLLAKVRPDILHINNGGYPGAKSCTQLALIASIILPSKIVYQINNITSTPQSVIARLIDIYLVKHCQFITASKFSEKKLISDRGFPKSCITRIFNTAPDDLAINTRDDFFKKWQLSKNTIILVQVAFLSARKGQCYLLEAIYLIKQKNPNLLLNTILFIVGDGEDAKKLKHLCCQYGLDSIVKFVGYRNDSIEFITWCNIFLLPSVAHEDMPLVVLSAMKLGKVIIASRFSGIEEEIEDAVSGILINPNPLTIARDLADAILKQLVEPDVSLGDAAKRRYENLFSSNSYSMSLLKLYANLNKELPSR
jgi:glycosyltransferase involved in cell wall biosynthesis